MSICMYMCIYMFRYKSNSSSLLQIKLIKVVPKKKKKKKQSEVLVYQIFCYLQINTGPVQMNLTVLSL